MDDFISNKIRRKLGKKIITKKTWRLCTATVAMPERNSSQPYGKMQV
ncbi:hypothetical protein predicted by Glimmer/Critica [Acetobacter ghanensis]|uniref:Uncharacterized protein n=1 Tax=Acetobacter ghanensis TaxID=431306 RepID=A0A0U5FAC0_9PROT|nr:hypothetical protein predicted by Glimmer/Critica [Acetobacter ghanensis]